jgi:HEAT repeat protein
MNPQEQRAVREEARHWYEETKGRSPDDRLMAAFSSDRFEDWVAAARKLAKKRDPRPVPLLLKKLDTVRSFQKGELCEVIAQFGGCSTIEPIRTVLKDAKEPSDRIRAAIALWKLGDTSGVPLAIEYVSAEKQSYGG